MLTLRINWGPHSPDFPMYSVYTAEKYTVLGVQNDKYLHLVLDDGRVDINLGVGSRTFVMNDRGSTIDTIVVN
jgi:hypothetical protein